jgi:hypothetical protein
MKTYRFIRHHKVEDHCRLGWMIADTLEGTPHGQWSFLMAWLCDCKEVTVL